MTPEEIKKCKKNGYAWVSDDDTPYKICRQSGGDRWKAVLRQINKPCLHQNRTAAQAAIDERERQARLAEYRKSMEPITPEQAKDLRGVEPIFAIEPQAIVERRMDGNDIPHDIGLGVYFWTREAAEAAISIRVRLFSTPEFPRMDLIPPELLTALGNVFRDGAVHYGEHNWEKGIPLNEHIASLLRHVVAVMRGDHSENHDEKMAANVAMFIATARRIEAGKLPRELDTIGWCK